MTDIINGCTTYKRETIIYYLPTELKNDLVSVLKLYSVKQVETLKRYSISETNRDREKIKKRGRKGRK